MQNHRWIQHWPYFTSPGHLPWIGRKKDKLWNHTAMQQIFFVPWRYPWNNIWIQRKREIKKITEATRYSYACQWHERLSNDIHWIWFRGKVFLTRRTERGRNDTAWNSLWNANRRGWCLSTFNFHFGSILNSKQRKREESAEIWSEINTKRESKRNSGRLRSKRKWREKLKGISQWITV
jgi:hypothetical protein